MEHISGIGNALAQAIAAKDADAIRGLLAEDVDFKGLTPGRFWEGHSSDEVLDVLFANWFEPRDEIKSLLSCRTGSVGTRESTTYRRHITTPEEQYEVEQQVYFSVVAGKIGYLRMMCSGFMPITVD